MYSGDLCNYESYSNLKCLLCISATLECVKSVRRTCDSGYCGEKWVCPEGHIVEE